MLAHGVWLDRVELELIAERGATIVTNPVANLKLAVGGVFPYPAARAAGVAVGLGTDGAGSNNSLDLLSDLKAFALPSATTPTTRRLRRAPRPGDRDRRRPPLLGGGDRSRPAPRPTSCCSAPTPRSASAISSRTWSTRRRGRSSTPLSSPAEC